VLGQVELLCAEGEEGRAAFAEIQLARIALDEQCDEMSGRVTLGSSRTMDLRKKVPLRHSTRSLDKRCYVRRFLNGTLRLANRQRAITFERADDIVKRAVDRYVVILGHEHGWLHFRKRSRSQPGRHNQSRMYFSRKSITVFHDGVCGVGLVTVHPAALVDRIVAASRIASSVRKPFTGP
jgi:hypothetical protein